MKIEFFRYVSLRQGVWVELTGYKRYLKPTSPSSQGWAPWSANSCLKCVIDWMDRLDGLVSTNGMLHIL